jgi:H+/Cl- antiporter ClcA
MAAIELSNTRKNKSIVDRLLSLRIALVKIFSSLFMALGGGTVGREGPTIQIAASIFKIIYQVLPGRRPKITKQNMLITGAAAGLAATFNTPLGGIVFAIEGLTRTHFSYFRTAIFSSVIIAGLAVEAMLGPYLYLGYPNLNDLSSYVFYGVALVALISGLLGSCMAKLIRFIFAWKSKIKLSGHQVLYVVVCSLIVISLACFVDREILGSGKDVMQKTLFTSAKYVHWYTPILRISGLVFSFTTGAAGGIFAPSMSVGASVGSLVASWFNFSAGDTNMLILSGMVGFLTGSTRSPFTSIIIVLEMTDRRASAGIETREHIEPVKI